MRLGTIGLWCTAFAVVAALAAAFGHRTRIVPLGPAFLLFGAGLLAALIAAAVSVLGLIFALMRTPRTEGVLAQSALALVLAIAVIAIPTLGVLLNRGSGLPAIHDITTDLEDPPAFVDVLPLRADAANPSEYGGPGIAAQQRRAYPDILPVTIDQPPEQVFDRALATVQELGWTVAASNRQAGRIEATDTTFWFGFKDDVVVRIRPANGGSRVDVRSLSRVGGGDVGTNAKRIRTFMERLRRT